MELKNTSNARKLVDKISDEKDYDIKKRLKELGEEFTKLHMPITMMIVCMHVCFRQQSSPIEILILLFFTFKILPKINLKFLAYRLDKVSNEMEIFIKFVERIKPVIGVFAEYNKSVVEEIEKDILSFMPLDKIDLKKEFKFELIIHLIVLVLGGFLFYRFIYGSGVFIYLVFIYGLYCLAKTVLTIRKIMLI